MAINVSAQIKFVGHTSLMYYLYSPLSDPISFFFVYRDDVCMYVCMVITYSRVWINRVRLPILLVVSLTGKIIFPCPRARLKIWSPETGSAVPSRVSLLISILRLNLVLTYGIPPEFRSGVHLFI